MAFNCFDSDKTPLLVTRNENVLFNDALNSRVCILKKNIVIAKAVCEGEQMQAYVNFHQPNDEEKEFNKISSKTITQDTIEITDSDLPW